MVQKIQTGEYCKRYWNMTVSERQSYQERVGQWLRSGGRMLLERADDFGSRLQNVLGVSVSWNDKECAAFEEGASLLSVLVGVSETWLPDLLYAKSARRSIRQMVKCLRKGIPSEKVKKVEPAGRKEVSVVAVLKSTAPKVLSAVKASVRKEERAKKAESVVEKNAAFVVEKKADDILPVRPKHIDQYVHLLPKKTQDRAGQVRGLLRDMDVARENARRLMDANDHSDKIAQWARKATSLDDKVRSIYKELDAEWEKLVRAGRVVVDDFGNARVVPDGEPSAPVVKPELTSEQKRRRRNIRKWLIDTRRGVEGKSRENRIEQWKVNIREYLMLEPMEAVLKDEKVVSAAEHYGISLKEELGCASVASPNK